MNSIAKEQAIHRPAGYSALIERYGLHVIPNRHKSLVATSGIHRVRSADEFIEEIYPSKYWPGDTSGNHLEFALKYDGTNLAILASIFQKITPDEIVQHIASRPTGKYARRLWFLYEFLMETALPIEDLKQGNYVNLLDAEEYYTATPARQVRRQRINDNLLGTSRFCPTVRRTEILKNFESADLAERCRKVIAGYSTELLRRAMGYLYTKETKSSFELEHITANSARTERFVALLQLAESEDFCNKMRLIDLQNRIVDPRFCDKDYRTTQNYIGETIAWQHEKIHFVCPKPEDLPSLMMGLLDSHAYMGDGGVSVVVHAAVMAYGFVFLHPFDDGNGRIHRFLIHNILARCGFTPKGVMFPVSASMLANRSDYDASLEAFSHPLMSLVEYSLDEDGRMTVHNDTARWYRYLDITPQAEALFRFIQMTIENELVEELNFLVNYDRTKKAIQEIVDMPDRQIDLFIQACLQNNGTLSARKRQSHFNLLSDDEISRMEQAIRASYGNKA